MLLDMHVCAHVLCSQATANVIASDLQPILSKVVLAPKAMLHIDVKSQEGDLVLADHITEVLQYRYVFVARVVCSCVAI
jgi:hypothetical protein